MEKKQFNKIKKGLFHQKITVFAITGILIILTVIIIFSVNLLTNEQARLTFKSSAAEIQNNTSNPFNQWSETNTGYRQEASSQNTNKVYDFRTIGNGACYQNMTIWKTGASSNYYCSATCPDGTQPAPTGVYDTKSYDQNMAVYTCQSFYNNACCHSIQNQPPAINCCSAKASPGRRTFFGAYQECYYQCPGDPQPKPATKRFGSDWTKEQCEEEASRRCCSGFEPPLKLCP